MPRDLLTTSRRRNEGRRYLNKMLNAKLLIACDTEGAMKARLQRCDAIRSPIGGSPPRSPNAFKA